MCPACAESKWASTEHYQNDSAAVRHLQQPANNLMSSPVDFWQHGHRMDLGFGWKCWDEQEATFLKLLQMPTAPQPPPKRMDHFKRNSYLMCPVWTCPWYTTGQSLPFLGTVLRGCIAGWGVSTLGPCLVPAAVLPQGTHSSLHIDPKQLKWNLH